MISHSRLIYINSAIRQSGNDGNFNAAVLMPREEKFTHVCVVEANIPKSYYLVQDGYTTFTLMEDGFPILVTVPIGNYNVNSFAKMLASLMTDISLHNCV